MNEWIILILFIVGVLLAFPAAILISIFLGWLVSKERKVCGTCKSKALKLINSIICQLTIDGPGPSVSFYRCEECGAEYVREGRGGMVKRENSQWRNGYNWMDLF